ncbi:MAG: UDP-N-acetylmuramoyl-L-alanyl-D-glutamate--2,6-diaminopimelate ligase [Candidatus Omnitrophica bacterium]|nr:UDP-N-acetylmuramoyl-L-alanyl-D-glutamate--2,6-diaminopimelate ligase [Candidatus Omnitrophota bacterium]
MERPKFTSDSRKVQKGDIFIALKGAVSDGHQHIESAIDKGAKFCIVQKDIWKKLSKKVHVSSKKIKIVQNSHKEYSRNCSEYFDEPSKKLFNIGITGTNGKTTVSFLLDKILKDSGKRTGLIGTIYYKIGEKTVDADRTTPDAFTLNRLLSDIVREKIKYSIMEVSSHALEQERAGHVFYDVAVFTNLTPEHMDYHKNINSYFKAKKKIFVNLKKKGIAIVNIDDPKGKILKKELKNRCIGFSVGKKTDVYAENIEMTLAGSTFDLNVFDKKYKVKTSLIGRHNISNILAAVSAGVFLGINIKDVIKSIGNAKPPDGRLQPVKINKKFKVFVDYAHTADALLNVLRTLQEIRPKQIITVFGCGGDRDKTKRPKMGEVACMLSDKVLVTSDNPRTEDPACIINDIVKGIKKYISKVIIEKDRREAIKIALNIAQKDSIVIIAGKGHEKYQIIGNKKMKFDDVKVVKELIGVRD